MSPSRRIMYVRFPPLEVPLLPSPLSFSPRSYPSLPQLQRAGMHAVIKQINNLVAKRAQLFTELERVKTDAVARVQFLPGLSTCEAAISRNKRCALAYLHYRFAVARNLWWDAAGVLPDPVREALSPEELESMDEYAAAVREYQDECGTSLLTDLRPPADIHTRVVILRDCGEVLTHYGPLRLDRGARHVLWRLDADVLIRQGLAAQTGD